MASYLSDKVTYQIITIGKEFLNHEYETSNHKCYVNNENVIKWNLIEHIFNDCFGDNFDIQNFSSEWYDEKIRKVFPIYMDTDFHFKQIDMNIIEISIKYLDWTHRLEDIKYFLMNTDMNNSTYCLEGILLLSSIFERALGNVYLQKGVNVPFLLRDLLNTDEIVSIFGRLPILFTQILLGTPKSLNLRNVVWHGFPHNSELYPCYVSALVLILNSFGYILYKQNILYENLPSRPQMNNLIEFSNSILSQNKLMKVPNNSIIIKILHDNIYLVSQIKVFDEILLYYKTKQNGRFVLLLLPQFEHFMRKIYCDINCMPDRTKTAENNTLYITLDDIFEYKLKNNDVNAIYNEFNENVLTFYHDIFTFQDGPRIRDKFSHGEINLNNIPDEFVDILLSMFLLFVCSTYKRSDYGDFCSEYLKTFENYNSVFHPNAILKYNILNLKQQLELVPEYFRQSTNIIDCSNIINLINHIEHTPKPLLTNFNNNLYELLTIQKVPTLNRLKIEVQIIGLLNRIIKVSLNADKGFRKSFITKFNLFQNKQLHSRQRKSYTRMESFTPFLFKGLELICCIVALYTAKIFDLHEITNKQLILSFFKKVLQCVEIIESNIVLDKNHWDVIKAVIDEITILFEKNEAKLF